MNKFFNVMPFFFLLILCIGFVNTTQAQQLSAELNAKISASDKQKLQKADDQYAKGQKIENDIPAASKDERKSQLKWLEAAEYYQKANAAREDVYTDNIKSFWKKYTGEKNLLNFAKKVEVAASDSFKRAGQLRATAEKERKLPDRISALQKAERLESKSLLMMQKVLYTYLNWPIEYNHVWISTDDQKLPEVNTAPVAKQQSIQEPPVKSEAKKDTAVAKRDTNTKITNVARPKTNVIIVKPKQVAGLTPGSSGNTAAKDTTSKQTLATTPSQTVPTTIAPVSTPVTAAPSKTIPETKPVEKKVSQDTIQKKTVEKPAPANTNVAKKEKTEVVVGNDSSLYGKMKVKEDQIDKFNDFLKNKYPSKMENYVINFQELDYSDINSLRQAWERYQYGYVLDDTTAMLAMNKDTISKVQKKPDELKEQKGQKVLVASSNNKKQEVATQKPPVKGEKKAIAKEETIVAVNNAKRADNKVTTTKAPISESTSTEPAKAITEGFVFRVQIVACRVQLDQTTLSSIYNGSLPIIELHEDGWYKYAIGEYSTYKDARQLRDKSTTPGVFVIAYLNGKRIKITPAIAYKRFSSKVDPASLKPASIKYYIQIVASKSILSDTYIKNIYGGPIPVEVMKDNGWNKYMLPGGKTFKEANNLLKKIEVPGAFIVAYHQDTRIDVQTATKLTDK